MGTLQKKYARPNGGSVSAARRKASEKGSAGAKLRKQARAGTLGMAHPFGIAGQAVYNGLRAKRLEKLTARMMKNEIR